MEAAYLLAEGVTSPLNSYVLPTLDYLTTYYWMVVPYNGIGDPAEENQVWNFTTIPDPNIYNDDLPYVQNFDSVTTPALPFAWDKVGTAGSVTTQAAQANSAPNSLYMYSSGESSIATVALPPVILSGEDIRMRFMARSNYTTGGIVQVGYLTDRTDPATFVLLDSKTTTLTHQQFEVALGEVTGVKHFALRAHFTPANSVAIDDVVIELVPTAPILFLTPNVTSWDFGNALIGTGATKQFTITNTGLGILQIDSITTTGDMYSISVQPTETQLATNESTNFTVQYMPTAQSTLDSGSFTINHSDATPGRSREALTVDLTGTALPPTAATTGFDPVDDATNVARNKPLIWTAATGSPSGYKLYLGTDNPPTNIVNGTNLGMVLTYAPAALYAANTEHFWKIVPFNANGDAEVPGVLSFTTGTNVIYAASTATNPADTDIGQVVIGAFANPETAPTPILNNSTATGLYTDFTALGPIQVQRGVTTPVSITQITSGGTFYPSYVKIFADLNQNGTFDLPDEILFEGPITSTANPLTGNLTIPITAQLGTTRLRVVQRESGTTANTLPTGTYSYGETEDYTLEVLLEPDDPIEHVVLQSPPDTILNTLNPNNVVLSWLNGAGGIPDRYEVYVSDERETIFEYMQPYVVNAPAMSLNLSAEDFDLDYDSVWYWAVVPYRGEETPELFDEFDELVEDFMIWRFKIMPDPTIYLPWSEDFTGVATGGLATDWTRTHTNWGANASANAGGTGPEMRLYYSPSATADMKLITPQLNIRETGRPWTVSFKHFLDWYAVPYTIKLQISDDGIAWTDVWSIVDPTANVGPATVLVDLGVKNAPFYLAWVGSGYSFNIDNWYIDDVQVFETPVYWDLTMLAPVGSGSTIPGVGVHAVAENSVVNLTARPALGFFDKWEVDGALYSTDRIAPLTIDADYEAQAFFSLPAGALAEDFNLGNPVPGEWTQTFIDTSWESGAGFFFEMFGDFALIGQVAGDAEEMLITPEVILDGSITEFAYWLAGGNNVYDLGSSTVQVKYQPVGTRTWTNLGAPIDLADGEDLQYVVLDLTAIPNGNYKFAFAVSSTFDYGTYLSWVGIDNVVGPVLASATFDDLEVLSVSYPKQIINAGGVAVLSAQIKNSGINPKTGTQVTFTVNDGRTVLTTNIGTLNYGETETVTVNYTAVGGRHTITASVPADDNNANNVATTQAVVAVPGNLQEGFEGAVEGWAADARWYVTNIDWLPPYEGIRALYNHDAANYTGSYLITPKVVLTGTEELNFYASFGNQTTGAASIAIDYSADGETWTNILPAFAPAATMQLYTVDLSAIPAGQYYLAFVTSGSTDGTYRTILCIDHVVGPLLAPEAVDTPANLAIAMVEGVPQLSWDAVTGANSYNVYVGSDPYGTFTPLGSTDEITYDLTGVDSHRFYYVTASTDPLVTYASRNAVVVSKKSSNRGVSLISQDTDTVTVKEHIVPKTTINKNQRVPKGL